MYKTILLPIDLNQESSWRKALPTTVEYCRAFGAELHLMTVVPELAMPIVAQYFPSDYVDRAVSDAKAQLEQIAADRVPEGVKVVTEVGHGTIYEEILKAAKQANCDLIVMASHRPELKDYLLGPNAARVARHAECSVLVVR